MKALFDSLVRTLVPYIVGYVVSLLVGMGLTLDSELERNLTSALTLAFGTLYYVGARWLETYVAPKFGWLLGMPKSPVYVKTEEPMAKTDVAVIQTPAVGAANPTEQRDL